MNKFRKKKGSSLILVIFITAVIFTVATAMVAVVTNDYRTRVNESKKLQNLYQSDAGLDVAYSLISKNAQNATMYAYNLAKDRYNNQVITDNEGLKNEFDKAFLNFLKEENMRKMINEVKVMKLKQSVKSSVDAGSATAEMLSNLDNYELAELTGQNILELTGGKKNNFQTGSLKMLSYKSSLDKKSITITVQSKFDCSDNGSNDVNGKLNNTRIIKTKYTINVPDYNEPANSQQVGNKQVRNYNIEKAITADGNLNIKQGASLNVSGYDVNHNETDGDIWIKGDQKQVTSDYTVAADKYAYGVRMDNASLNVNGNCYTNGTVGLSNGSSADINTIYALNVYTGPIAKTDFNSDSGNNTLNAQNIFTNNDLVMNSNKSLITANRYTGISDLKEQSQTDGSVEEKAKAAKNSSAIIVNTDEANRNGATIKISDTAVVPGFAYMNTAGNSFYGTGEAVAVKGNYKAYTETLVDGAKKQNYDPIAKYDVKEYKPWDLVEFPDSQNSVKDKAETFKLYWNPQSQNIDDGGVEIANLKSYGSAPDDGNGGVKGYTVDKDITAVQNVAKSAFGKNVYGMGQTDKEGNDYYSAGENRMLTVAGNNNVIHFDVLEDRLTDYVKDKLVQPVNTEDENSIYKNYNGYALLNTDSNNELNISKTDDGITVNYTDGRTLEIKGNELNAVIITNGNVNISGNVKINGTIISGGSVNIAEKSKVQIVCDRKVIKNIIHQINSTIKINSDTGLLENGISDSTPIEGEQPYTIQDDNLSYTGPLDNKATNGWYDSSVNIKQGLWKLVKDSK